MVLKGINESSCKKAVTYGRHRTRSAGMETSGAGLEVKAGAGVFLTGLLTESEY